MESSQDYIREAAAGQVQAEYGKEQAEYGKEQADREDRFDRLRKNLFVCTGVNLLFLLLILLIMQPVFDSNDDMNIAFFVNLARPIQDPYLLFENTILGWVCAALYRVTNMVPWYGILQYLGMFCAFTGVTWGIQQLFKKWSALALNAFLILFFAADAYINVQFTKTAGVCAAAGLFLVVFAMTRRHVHRGALLAGCLITLYGYLYRDREAYVMIALWCVFGAGLLMRLNEVKAGKRFRKVQGYFVCLAMVLVLCAAAWATNKVAYRMSEEATQYKELNDVRSDIMDYGFPPYEGNEKLYEDLGISRNAWQLFSKWNFYDPEVFTLDVQKKILAAQEHKAFDTELIRDFFDKYPYKWFENPMFYCFLVMAVLVLVYGSRKWQIHVTVLMEAAAITGVFFIMFWNGRYNLQRVDSPIWLCGCLILAFLLDRDKFILDSRAAVTMILIVLALNQRSWSKKWRHNMREEQETKTYEANLAAEIASDQDHLYLSKVGLYAISTAYDPLSLVPLDVASNACVLGGWPAGSPSYVAVLERYGIENPFKDSINNEKVYWIDNHIDWTISYLHEYYDEKVQAKQTGTFEKEKVYQLVSE